MYSHPEIEIKNLEMQEETGEHAHISVEFRFDGKEPQIVVLQDGSYEHFVDIYIDHSTGKVYLGERPHTFPSEFNPTRPGQRWTYRNEILLFDSSWNYETSQTGEQPKKIEETNPFDHPPVYCPRCKSKNITTYMVVWSAQSDEDQSNQNKINEHQCNDCEGASFWT